MSDVPDIGAALRALVEQCIAEQLPAVVTRELERRGLSVGEWLTVPEAVALTGLSEWTIYEAIRRGELEAFRPRPKCTRILPAKLLAWAEEQTKKNVVGIS
jgi:excisionase family DNA binding protein